MWTDKNGEYACVHYTCISHFLNCKFWNFGGGQPLATWVDTQILSKHKQPPTHPQLHTTDVACGLPSNGVS